MKGKTGIKVFRFFRSGTVLLAFLLLTVLPPNRDACSEAMSPLHKSEPNMQVHQYVAGEAARIWPGTNGLDLISQSDWTDFFNGAHHEVWDYIGARTEYHDVPPNPTIENGTITYGGRYGGSIVETILWTPPDLVHDVPYSAFDASQFNTLNPLVDPLENDDGSGLASGNLTVGSWPAVGDDIVEGAHEEDLFFIHALFGVLYDMYGDPAFNPATDYLQDEFYNGLDWDGAEVFYHHLWRRKAHNDSDIGMMGVSWENSQSPWEEVIVMPDIFEAHPSPIQVAEGYWQSALDYYLGRHGRPQDKGLAYYFLGRVAHLLVDMCVPAHAHCDPHSPVWPDSYEDYMGELVRYAEYTHAETPLFDANGQVIGTEAWSYTIGDWDYKAFSYVRQQIPGEKWDFNEPDEQLARDRWESQSNLFHLFWCTAEIADNYDSNDANGDVDGGTRSAEGFSEFELRSIADELMPQSIISLAELYKLFWDTILINELTQISLSLPENQATLGSRPTFTWTVDGGRDNVFAVDASLSSGFATYWSTYDDLNQLIYGESWTMPLPIWNRIPSGKEVFWRVRGADLDHEPLSVITSDEVRSFTKE